MQYTYDNKRRVKSVSLNGMDDYVTYTYSGEHTNAETVKATMVDGTVATTVKNAHGNVTKSTCGDRTVTNTYDTDQRLTKTVDSVSGETTIAYDDKGNVISVTAPDHTEELVYDDKNVLTSKKVNGTTYEFTYKATADKALDSISVDGNTVSPATDALGRNAGKVIEVGDNKVAEEKISYVKFGDHATNLPSTVRFASNGVFKESMQYKYDSMGNIVEIFENGRSVCRYEYDALGRLTREDNVAFGKTTTWAYDNNGNIIAKYEYEITAKPTSELHLLDCTTFTYCYAENSDRLLSITKDDGESVATEQFVYDAIGNPTTYRGMRAEWEYGRQLKLYDGNTYTYDARGRRISKQKGTDTAITFTYDSNGNLIKQSNGLEFLYDHTGVFAVKYGTQTYFYRKDAQSNIVELLDSNGAVVVKYKYDAWGNCVIDASTTNTELANLNPFRYRSYYYDTETNLYFLKTRYYDPEIGRFMTIDDISYLDPDSINGLNLYAYCGNNPVMNIDPIGKAFLSALIISIIIGAVISGAISGVTAYNEGVRGIGLIGSILGGAIMGAAMGAILTIGGAAGLASLGVSIAGYTLTSTWAALGVSVAIGVGAGVASYGVENGLREDRTLSVKGFVLAGLSGGLKGAATFGIGFVGGKFGAFDKMFIDPLLKGAYTLSTSLTYELAKGIMASAFPSIGRTILTTASFYIGEFLTKLLFVSSTAAVSRWIIDQFFDS